MSVSPEQIDENKQLVRDFADLWASGDVNELDELVADDCVFELSGMEPLEGREALAGTIEYYQTAFPDLEIEIHQLVAEDDTVVKHYSAMGTHEGEFMGIEPTGKDVETPGISVYHCDDGKIVKATIIADSLVMFQQLEVDSLPAT